MWQLVIVNNVYAMDINNDQQRFNRKNMTVLKEQLRADKYNINESINRIEQIYKK